MNVEIGAFILRPRGRNDVDVYDANNNLTYAATEMALKGIKIGAANATKQALIPTPPRPGRWLTSSCSPASSTLTPMPMASPFLHMGIEWYRGADENQIPTGAFFYRRNRHQERHGCGTGDHQSRRVGVGGIQIRYLDVVFVTHIEVRS